MQISIHPETGSILKRDVRPQVVRYGAMEKIIDTPGWYPDDDGDAIHEMKDLDECDAAFIAMRAA